MECIASGFAKLIYFIIWNNSFYIFLNFQKSNLEGYKKQKAGRPVNSGIFSQAFW